MDKPNVLFLGLEEYCNPGSKEQREGIWKRCTEPEFAEERADKNRATAVLDSSLRFESVPVWRVMSEIVAGLSGRSPEAELHALGTRPSEGPISTLLTELRPLPRPGTGSYRGTYIEEWFSFRGKSGYERVAEELTTPRTRAMFINPSPPLFAFVYGLPACAWAQRWLASEVISPFVPGENGVEVARTREGTTVVLTGFYEGQHARTAFRRRHIPKLLSRIGSTGRSG